MRVVPTRRLTLTALGAACALALPIVAACGGDDAASTSPAASTSAVAGCTVTAPPSAAAPPTFDAAPPTTIDAAKTYTAVMDTSCGELTFALDAKNAPITVNSFVFLAGKHYFDGLTFHRIISGFMAQGGDPTGTGAGGPGYEFPNETPTRGYQVGDIAMANAGPGTNGSQFFIVTGPEGTSLPPDYTLFGTLTKGKDVLARLDALGDPNADNGVPPRQPVYIRSIRVTATTR